MTINSLVTVTIDGITHLGIILEIDHQHKTAKVAVAGRAAPLWVTLP